MKGRPWHGDEACYRAHSDTIRHWCEGGEVEAFLRDRWVYVATPAFHPLTKYRIKHDKASV